MRGGQSFSQLVEFTVGHPDGDVAWTLLDGTGTQIATGAVTPAVDAVSCVVEVSGGDNTPPDGELFAQRELQWRYSADGLIRQGRVRYRIDAFLPFGVSEDGVRRKLGLEAHELDDDSIDLVAAYLRFQEQVTPTALSAATGFAALQACDAIEAWAGLVELPTLQLKLAQKESSGTDQYQRADVDWDAIRVQLDQFIAMGISAVNPQLDTTANFGSLLILVTRDDPVTGAVG